MEVNELKDQDWELRFFFRIGSDISIDIWQRFENCKFLSEKDKEIVIRRGRNDSIEERTDWYLNVGEAVGLKARGVQGRGKTNGSIIELKIRTTVGKEVEEGAQKAPIRWLLKYIEQWPKRELSERFLYKAVSPFSTRPERESTRYRDIGVEDTSSVDSDDSSQEDRPSWKWKVLKRRFETCSVEPGLACDQLKAAGLIKTAGSKSDHSDPSSQDLSTIAVEKRRQMVHFKSVDVDMLIGKKKKRVKRIEMTEVSLGVAGSNGCSTPRKIAERWISICIEGKHAVPCAKLLNDLCPELAFKESADLYFGGYPGFIQHALKYSSPALS